MPDFPAISATEGRERVLALLPVGLPDRPGWAADIYAAVATLQVAPTRENLCAIIAVTAQESGFKVDPPVPNLSAIAWKEIDRHAERAGVPKLVLHAALALPSSNGRSYNERLDRVTTELELSDIYDDLIGRVPLAKRFFADSNPVRTGGPMQVGVAFAREHVKSRPYPYPRGESLRAEVFTRRGGLYFGIAHLLDYTAPYDRYLYRFADFNAGQYASRNAAFQKAVTEASGVPLVLDGDLLRYEQGEPAKEAGSTELAVRSLASRLEMTPAEIRRDLESARTMRFEASRVYTRTFELAERATGKPFARAVVPAIELHSPKFSRKLTTAWFAQRVGERQRACLASAERRG